MAAVAEPLSPIPSQSPDQNERTSPHSMDWTHEEISMLHSWIYCFCLVDFDLELGQVLRFSYPDDILCEEECQNVANLSFPDTHSTRGLDTLFCFRFRTSSLTDLSPAQIMCQRDIQRHPYLFGYVCFRRYKDASLPRGHFQKAVVVISPLPYTHVFRSCVETVGALYFEYGSSILEAACRNIAGWPSPTEKGSVLLPLLGNTFNVILNPQSVHASAKILLPEQKRDTPHTTTPTTTDILSSSDIATTQSQPDRVAKHLRKNFCRFVTRGVSPQLALEALHECDGDWRAANAYVAERDRSDDGSGDLSKRTSYSLKEMTDGSIGTNLIASSTIDFSGGCFQEINLFKHFQSVLGNLWFLWEIAMTGAPCMVVSSSAEQCSHVVLGIMSLISPITFQGDFRPYFTIYDSDFKHFCSLHDREMLPCLLLGVTNPLFLKTMPKMPNVLFINDGEDGDDAAAEKPPSVLSPGSRSSDSSSSLDAILQSKRKKTKHKQSIRRVKSTSSLAFDAESCSGQVISNLTPNLVPDQKVLDRLLWSSKPTKDNAELEQIHTINDAVLRKYFQALTREFLESFDEYFEFRTSKRYFNPYLNPPQLKSFNLDEFCEEIRSAPRDKFSDFPLRFHDIRGGKRTSLVNLYRAFINSPHFPSWFHEKRENGKIMRDIVIVNMIKTVPFVRLVDGQPIADGVRMYQQIHKYLQMNAKNTTPDPELNQALLKHRETLRKALPHKVVEKLDERATRDRKKQIESQRRRRSTGGASHHKRGPPPNFPPPKRPDHEEKTNGSSRSNRASTISGSHVFSSEHVEFHHPPQPMQPPPTSGSVTHMPGHYNDLLNGASHTRSRSNGTISKKVERLPSENEVRSNRVSTLPKSVSIMSTEHHLSYELVENHFR